MNSEICVTIGMFDPAAYAAQPNQSGNQDIEIVNMLGFKLTAASFVGNTITGEIVGAPGAMVTGVCSVGPCPTSTGLINIIRLVR